MINNFERGLTILLHSNVKRVIMEVISVTLSSTRTPLTPNHMTNVAPLIET